MAIESPVVGVFLIAMILAFGRSLWLIILGLVESGFYGWVNG